MSIDIISCLVVRVTPGGHTKLGISVKANEMRWQLNLSLFRVIFIFLVQIKLEKLCVVVVRCNSATGLTKVHEAAHF